MSKGKLYFILLQLIFIQNAFAYLDPGTWTYVIQMLAAVFVGAIVGIKMFWQHIKLFFSELFRKKSS